MLNEKVAMPHLQQLMQCLTVILQKPWQEIKKQMNVKINLSMITYHIFREFFFLKNIFREVRNIKTSK